jgi:hypothetical protein
MSCTNHFYFNLFYRKEIVPDFSKTSGPRQTSYGYTVIPPKEDKEVKEKERPLTDGDRVFLGRGRKLNE